MPIFLLKIFKLYGGTKGFSLLEILIVLGIISGTVVLFVSRIVGPNSELKDFVREMGVVSRNVYYRAKLHQVPYRLVIDMKSGGNSLFKHEYWVERGEKGISVEKDAAYKKFEEGQTAEEDDEGEDSNGFTLDKAVTNGRKELPNGLIFQDVETIHSEQPYDNGKVYVYFFPQGFVDEVAVHLQYEGEKSWTLSFHPLTARAEIAPEYRRLEKITNQQ